MKNIKRVINIHTRLKGVKSNTWAFEDLTIEDVNNHPRCHKADCKHLRKGGK